MPYSKKFNTLFVHIPKCAGKSFEVAMGIVQKSEVTKYKWRSTLNRAAKFGLNKTKDLKALPRLWGVHDMSLALQHLTYSEIELLGLLDAETRNKAIKVAIVRNPFDRAVSSYHHMGKDYDSFLEFLKKYYVSSYRDHNELAHRRPQVDFLRNKKGEIIVDNIIRFENLNEDFEAFKNKYSILAKALPHIGKQREDKSYKKFFCDESHEIVVNLFKEDIELLNYQF